MHAEIEQDVIQEFAALRGRDQWAGKRCELDRQQRGKVLAQYRSKGMSMWCGTTNELSLAQVEAVLAKSGGGMA